METYWQVFGLTAIGVFIGEWIAAFAVALLSQKTNNTDRQFEINCFLTGIVILLIAGTILYITAPISHWLEIAIIGAGISGFAGRWLGVTSVRKYDRNNSFSVVLAFLVPMVIVGLLVGVANHFWIHFQM